MPIRKAIRKVGTAPPLLTEAQLPSEKGWKMSRAFGVSKRDGIGRAAT